MKVAFRVDASVDIGSGHVMRCLTLANTLRERGAAVAFVCRELEGNLCELIESNGIEVLRLPGPGERSSRLGAGDEGGMHAKWLGVDWNTDARETREAMVPGAPWDWMVVDHYALDARWEGDVRALAKQVMAIDDLADRAHECELLLDQNLYSDMERRYGELAPPHCIQLLGPRYALLRPEFPAARRVPGIAGDAKRLLVFFGGVDAQNMTARTLDAISALGRSDLVVDVVVGSTNPHVAELRYYCEERKELTLHVQVSDLARLMAKADLAVGAGGTATWERCCVGVPALAWPIASNQAAVLADAADRGILYQLPREDPTSEEIRPHLRSLIENPHLRRHLSDQGRRFVDGHGAERVAGFLAKPELELRRASQEDAAAMFAWRNDPSVRRHALDSSRITREDQESWLAGVLRDPDRELLIGMNASGPVGVIRFDIDGDQSTVSIYLVPGLEGRGLGRELLAAGENWLLENRPEVRSVSAMVKPDNLASRKMFEFRGYSAGAVSYRKSLK